MTESDAFKLSPAQQALYDYVCRMGSAHVANEDEAAAALREIGLVTLEERDGRWHLRPARYAGGYPTRAEASKAARAYFASGASVLAVEGSDFHVVQRDGERWHFEAGRDPASN